MNKPPLRALTAAMRAVALGYPDVRWYRGGTQAWEKAKLPLVWAQRTKWRSDPTAERKDPSR